MTKTAARWMASGSAASMISPGSRWAAACTGAWRLRACVDPDTGEILAERDEMLDHDLVRKIVSTGVEEVKVRSPLTCELIHGICAKCYGLDLGRGKMVDNRLGGRHRGRPVDRRAGHAAHPAHLPHRRRGCRRRHHHRSAPRGRAVRSPQDPQRRSGCLRDQRHGARHAVRPLQRPAHRARRAQRDDQRRI